MNPAFGQTAAKKKIAFDIEEAPSKKQISFNIGEPAPSADRKSRTTSTSNMLRSRTISTVRNASEASSRAFSTAGGAVLKNLAPAYVVEGATADLFDVKADLNGTSYSCYLWKQSKCVPPCFG